MPSRAFVIASERDVGRGVFVTLSACYGRRCDSREQADDVVFDGVLFVEHNFILTNRLDCLQNIESLSCTRKYPDELSLNVSIIGNTELTAFRFSITDNSIGMIFLILIQTLIY